MNGTGGGENRDVRNNNRRNRDDNNFRQMNGGDANGDRQPKPRGGGGSGGQGGGGQRRFNDRNKFDRQSNSDKAGVKPVYKREGGGAHNWGSHKQDLEDSLNPPAPTAGGESDTEKATDPNATLNDSSNTAEANGEQNGNTTVPAEEETKELTLDEWRAQRGERAKPQYNLRKAGEGEDLSQWKKMVPIQNKRTDKGTDDTNSGEEELEYDPSLYPQRVGRQKRVMEIQFHFNDGRRGDGNRRGGPGRRRDGPREQGGPPAEGGNAAGGEGRNNRRQGGRNRNGEHVSIKPYTRLVNMFHFTSLRWPQRICSIDYHLTLYL